MLSLSVSLILLVPLVAGSTYVVQASLQPTEGEVDCVVCSGELGSQQKGWSSVGCLVGDIKLKKKQCFFK